MVIGVSVAMFVAIAATNFVVNPYAQYGGTWIEPLVQTSRATKVQLLTSTKTAPEGLILGSSRVLKLEPAYLQEKLGHDFFNAGVNYGKPEDFLAMLRLYQSHVGTLPRTVVLGLDVHGFSPTLPMDARLLSNQHLAGEIQELIPLDDRFNRWKELLSWQQTTSSLKSLKRWVKNETDESPIESFCDDGLLVYHQREREIAEGTYDFAGALDYNKHEYRQLFAGYDKLSAERIETLKTIVDTCASNGSRLIIFMTPMHPELINHLSDTSYAARQAELKEHLAHKASLGRFVFNDLSTVQTFNGDAGQFVDGIHPLESNTRKMIDLMVRNAETGGQYVIQ